MPIDLTLVNGLIALTLALCLGLFLFLFVFLFHFFFVLRFYTFCLLCLDLVFVLRNIDLVRCKQFLVRFGILQQLFHYADKVFCLVCRHTVKTETAWFLALPDEILEEVVQHIAVSVELKEVLCILRLGGSAFRIAVLVKSGYYADFARLLVTNNQHVLVFLFLFHCFLNLLFG